MRVQAVLKKEPVCIHFTNETWNRCLNKCGVYILCSAVCALTNIRISTPVVWDLLLLHLLFPKKEDAEMFLGACREAGLSTNQGQGASIFFKLAFLLEPRIKLFCTFG